MKQVPLLDGPFKKELEIRRQWLHSLPNDRLRPRVSPAARPLLTHGTGAMEKNIETVVGRRFKRWGMRWTRRGAHNLLKLRRWIARCGTTWFEALYSRGVQLTNA
jgi:hypothetical protein